MAKGTRDGVVERIKCGIGMREIVYSCSAMENTIKQNEIIQNWSETPAVCPCLTAAPSRQRLMDRAAALSADPPEDAVGPLVASLQPAPGPSPEVVQTQHRAALAELMSSAARRLRTGRRLEATLSRSGVSARCSRLEQVRSTGTDGAGPGIRASAL